MGIAGAPVQVDRLTGSTAGAVMIVQLVMPSFLLCAQRPANENGWWSGR